jgi:hypothetical protein
MTTMLVALSHFGRSPLQMSPWALIDAVIFAGFGWGIFRQSRTAAIGALLLFVVEKGSLWMDNGIPPNALSLVVVFALINAIRGTIAFHRCAPKPESTDILGTQESTEVHSDGPPLENEEYSCSTCGGRVVLGDRTCRSCGEHLEFT